jgi:eukaryotic-like serine/threonine-protein kinase
MAGRMGDWDLDKIHQDPQGSPGNLEKYLGKIRESAMFPAFSANIQELLSILEDPYYPIYEVSRVVLRDVSLTTQILKLVNSIFFQSRQREVHTISSAVMILGFELVRDLAVGLKLFENFQKSASLDKVMRLMFLSFFMALAAQELAQQDRRFEGEELFLTALLYNFGELAAAYYFPEEYRRVVDAVQERGLSKSEAVLQVFHFSLDDLGQALLKTWNFPEGLRVRLAELKRPGGDLPGPAGQRRRLFKGIEELSRTVLNPEASPEKIDQLQEKVARHLGLAPEVMARSLSVCFHRLQELTRILKLDMETLGFRLPIKTDTVQVAEVVHLKGQTTIPHGEAALPASQAGGGEPDQELARLTFLLQVMEEINQAIATRMPIHRVTMMILEGIYQGIGFDRVVFCLVDPKRAWVTGRFGLGEGVEALLPLLKASLADETNPLSLAVTQAREYLVGPESGPSSPPCLAEEFWRASRARAVLVSPILIDAAPIGVIYLDRFESQPAITAKDRQRLQSFRDLAVIALRQSSQRGQGGLTGCPDASK